MVSKKKTCDVLIVGGGVTGTALLYVLSRFTNIGKVALLEQYNGLGLVNTRNFNNSQTLHTGEIETNYSLEKALEGHEAGSLLANFLSQFGQEFSKKTQTMVIGV